MLSYYFVKKLALTQRINLSELWSELDFLRKLCEGSLYVLWSKKMLLRLMTWNCTDECRGLSSSSVDNISNDGFAPYRRPSKLIKQNEQRWSRAPHTLHTLLLSCLLYCSVLSSPLWRCSRSAQHSQNKEQAEGHASSTMQRRSWTQEKSIQTNGVKLLKTYL